ncbi:MAG TPA: hypothetical protein VHN99_00840 [Deinococcales bacterium]|nr:hypothetical protein [Deinococcales bacterium]
MEPEPVVVRSRGFIKPVVFGLPVLAVFAWAAFGSFLHDVRQPWLNWGGVLFIAARSLIELGLGLFWQALLIERAEVKSTEVVCWSPLSGTRTMTYRDVEKVELSFLIGSLLVLRDGNGKPGFSLAWAGTGNYWEMVTAIAARLHAVRPDLELPAPLAGRLARASRAGQGEGP